MAGIDYHRPSVGAACQGGGVKKLGTQEILDARLDDWRKLAQALHARYRITDFNAARPSSLLSRRRPRPPTTTPTSR
jgi:hypothetical protein